MVKSNAHQDLSAEQSANKSSPIEATEASSRVAAADASEHKAKMQELKKEQRKKVKSKLIERGVVVVNTGDGKGKSTAAFGIAIRAAGCGQKVGLIQFIKGTWKTGEGEALKRFPEVEHVVSGEGFTWETQDREKDIQAAARGWQRAKDMVESARSETPKFDVVILDEINIALGLGYLSLDDVVEVVRSKPKELSMVLTGRGAKQDLIDVADTVTEMTPLKHAFESGIKARRGVEF